MTPRGSPAAGPEPSTCLFEDRLAGRSLRLLDPVARIAVHRRDELPAAWDAIESARRAGHWVALLLDYELGEWLEPGAADPADAGARDPLPRLTALVHARAAWGACGGVEGPDSAGPADRANAASRTERPGSAGGADGMQRPDGGRVPDGLADARGLPWRPDPRPGVSRARHAQAIEAVRAGIARGDYYQINYTLPLRLDWPAGLDPARAYAWLAERHPVAHAACVCDGDRWVLSLSPELFVAREGARLRVRPMKGTAPRHADPAWDRQAAEALQRSVKNRAENLMIVDLLRNDLGRIAVPGSVRVPALFSLEAYPSVWTLTSTVEAEAPDAPLAEVLRALFPCGSVTGAPKIAAMRAIRALEARRRGIYCGSVGWLAPDGDFSLNVAIRTIELRGGRAEFGVGGGIVYDSRAAEEWEECLWKARVLNPE
ncbi:Para-aminobenzoate synthase, aminase component [Castellaniella defragrans 65Phen]|uniref:Para-aminobenzoate synthase, aminase component n=1 Tax=Castellaniella defragrans (strain DSM 12143 / CCUG 39792 / 65Phen) TaxID=1437824 RepID=W8X9T5_CASD6|nr:aminodeoxychorismate synthase component I [Castellaniella defragrans]CDM25385.1 Para-aminobenzoate synthase, aminase component [Castellaniella defragrans 65Phen]